MPLVPPLATLPRSMARTGDGGCVFKSPGMLFHPSGPSHSAPPAVPSQTGVEPPRVPDETLDRDAVRLTALLGRPEHLPPRWSAPTFVREVELVRCHLRPIRTRTSLSASFSREAFHGRLAPPSDARWSAAPCGWPTPSGGSSSVTGTTDPHGGGSRRADRLPDVRTVTPAGGTRSRRPGPCGSAAGSPSPVRARCAASGCGRRPSWSRRHSHSPTRARAAGHG